jgi:hypothetical protein
MDAVSAIQDLPKLLLEVRQILQEWRHEKSLPVKRRWLRVAEAALYLGVSENWIRELEEIAPRGLFRRVKGTVFLDLLMLDDIVQGDVELVEL